MEVQQSEPMPAPPNAEDSLVECALKILECPDPWRKADYTYATVKMWREGMIKRVRPAQWQHLRAPDRPARSDDKVRVCAPGEVPRRGRGGTLASRQALLHSAVHIENWAVDLSWDVVARFGLQPDVYDMPRQFFDDFVTVAEDECRHFSALAKRLEETGSFYGAFPVHDGLWESAAGTSHSLPARLAVEHCVHEARGLDVLPATIAKFANNSDPQSAALLRDVVYPEEVSHCAAGVRWIKYLYDIAHGRRRPAEPADAPETATPPAPGVGVSVDAGGVTGDADAVAVGKQLAGVSIGGAADNHQQRAPPPPPPQQQQQQGGADSGGSSASGGGAGGAGNDGGGAAIAAAEPPPAWVLDARQYDNVELWFHSLVRAHFWGALKPPFNEEARAQAGFGPEWYLPLAVQRQGEQQGGQQQQGEQQQQGGKQEEQEQQGAQEQE